MIQTKSVFSGYGKEEILHGVDFVAKQGEITTVIGKNGCGKSTLLKTVMGSLELFSGDILIDGESLQNLDRSQIARRIAYVPQSKNVPDISVGRLVLHGRFPYLSYPRRYSKNDIEIAHDIMKSMDIYSLRDRQMAELSGGMRQKVYIAMALVQKTDTIIMDEPTTYLDIGEQMRFFDMAKQLANSGKAIILVLHDLIFALRISDNIAVMQDGKVLGTYTPEELVKSDIIHEVYGVRIQKTDTQAGTQYFYV